VARTGLATTKTSGAAAGAIVALRAGSARDIRLFEVGVFASTAVSGTVGLGRPAAIGVTPGTATGPIGSGNGYDPVAGAGVSTIDASWGTAPTAPAVYWRRAVLPATIGAGVIWTFPDGIVIPVSATVTLHQISTAAVGYEIYFEIEE
jgi:hypothetical protein